MSEMLFLTLAQVERLHQKQIKLFGGMNGLRDPSLLEGAVIHPQNVYFYAKGDFFDVAAAYAFHLAQAQAFLDGNKRVGVSAALLFLELNGVFISASTEQLSEAMIAVAEKRMDKTALAALFRRVAESSAA